MDQWYLCLKLVLETNRDTKEYIHIQLISGLVGREDVRDTIVINAEEHRESRNVVNDYETVVEVLTTHPYHPSECRDGVGGYGGRV
jgi:hypothetical protein